MPAVSAWRQGRAEGKPTLVASEDSFQLYCTPGTPKSFTKARMKKGEASGSVTEGG